MRAINRPISASEISRFGIASELDGDKTEPREDAVQATMRWISHHCEKTKAIRTDRDSYTWKHMPERRGFDSPTLPHLWIEYVANGEFILAAMRLGYRAVQWHAGDPNACFNMRLKHEPKDSTQSMSRAPQPGYIYVFQAGDTGLFKVGRAADWRKRMRELQTACPHRLIYITAVHVEDMATGERAIHDAYTQQRTNGEWFELDAEQVLAIPQMLHHMSTDPTP